MNHGGFKPQFFSGDMTPPDLKLSTLRCDESCPVAFFQVSFIHDGLNLNLVFTTSAATPKASMCLRLLGPSTEASIDGRCLPIEKSRLNHSYVNATHMPSAAETEELGKKMRDFNFHEIIKYVANKLFNPTERRATIMKIYIQLRERYTLGKAGEFFSSHYYYHRLMIIVLRFQPVPILHFHRWMPRQQSQLSRALLRPGISLALPRGVLELLGPERNP